MAKDFSAALTYILLLYSAIHTVHCVIRLFRSLFNFYCCIAFYFWLVNQTKTNQQTI